VNVEHLDAEAGRLNGGLGDGIGNIVKFEIEKNLPTELLNLPDRLRSGMGEKLLADLEHANRAGEQADEVSGLFERVDIEGNDQALAHGAAFTNQFEL
jgi:hypothetical protein